jgi:peptidoglycan biosynthesis protein MviN/MurJ (putative lipid II flippase)
MTAKTLMAFAPSLIPFSLSRPLIQAFYAHNNTKIPVIVGVITLFINLITGILLIRFEVVGLALCLSISSSCQYLLLLVLFRRLCFAEFRSELLKPFLLHMLMALGACIVGLIVQEIGAWEQGFSIKNTLILGLMALMAGLSYMLASFYARIPEAVKLMDALRSRFYNL